MKNQRLKQFTASLLVVLSLFVSSVSACACSSALKTKDSCCQPPLSIKAEQQSPQHLHEAPDAARHEENLPENISISFSANECCGASLSPRLFAKTESVKIEKQKLSDSPISPIESTSVSRVVATKSINSVTPFYLSVFFQNLTPGRAPPRL